MLGALFLQVRAIDRFGGGVGLRYQARREIKSFWYPTCLAQPAEFEVNCATSKWL